MASDAPFWKTKPLAAMTPQEWESLCDGCGRCCLSKLEDEDTGRIYFTEVGCRQLDGEACRCRAYGDRTVKEPDCVQLTPENVGTIPWLPKTCAYRLLAEKRDLYWWHPLVSGDPNSVHAAGMSVRGRVALSEDDLGENDDLEDYIVNWPLRMPKRAHRR